MSTLEFREATLPNGLTIQAEIVPTALTAATGFFFRTGARDEHTPSMGVSHFLEHMMFKGTERRTAEEVNRELDDLGASHNAWTTAENTAYYVHTPYDVIHDAMDVLGDILRPHSGLKISLKNSKSSLKKLRCTPTSPSGCSTKRRWNAFTEPTP